MFIQACPVNSVAQRNSPPCCQLQSSPVQPSMQLLTMDRCQTLPHFHTIMFMVDVADVVCSEMLLRSVDEKTFSTSPFTVYAFKLPHGVIKVQHQTQRGFHSLSFWWFFQSLTGVPGFPTLHAQWDTPHQKTKMLSPWRWLWTPFLTSASHACRWLSHGIWDEHNQMQWVHLCLADMVTKYKLNKDLLKS